MGVGVIGSRPEDCDHREAKGRIQTALVVGAVLVIAGMLLTVALLMAPMRPPLAPVAGKALWLKDMDRYEAAHYFCRLRAESTHEPWTGVQCEPYEDCTWKCVLTK